MKEDRSTVVSPTRTDPVATAMSEVIGGPVGRHARPHPWWTPLRVMLVLGTVVLGLAIIRHQPCLETHWASDEARYAKMCYSDVPYLYTGRGLAEAFWPYDDMNGRYTAMEYPVGIAYFAWVAALVNQANPLTATGPPIDERRATPVDDVYPLPGIVTEIDRYFLTTAVLLTPCLLGAIWFLANSHKKRPWDALPFVLSPVLFSTALINWDLLAVLFTAGALWAWSRGRPGLTGVMIGLGAATKLYPLFLLGPLLIIAWRRRRLDDAARAVAGAAVAWMLANLPAWLTGLEQWKVFWSFNSERAADWGSVWLFLSRHGVTLSTEAINRWTWALFIVACVGVLVLGVKAPRIPRLAQLGFLVVAAFLILNKVYSPQYALWLLPLAVLARPRWRDLLIWQAGELIYFAAVWWNFGGWLAGSSGGDPAYDWAIVVRIAAQLYLVVVIVFDVLKPEPDGIVDDLSGEHDAVDVGGGEPDADLDLVADVRHR